MRYWARATWSALPLMVIVRSCLLASSEPSSYLLIVIMAPVICLQGKQITNTHINSTVNQEKTNRKRNFTSCASEWQKHWPDFSNLGASLADDAPDEFVGHGHLVSLCAGACADWWPQLRAGEGGQSCTRYTRSRCQRVQDHHHYHKWQQA